MTGSRRFGTVKHLIRDTFRQAWASGIGWVMVVGTAVTGLLCLSVSVNGDATLGGGDEPGLFLPPLPPAAIAPSVVTVLAGSGPVGALTLTEAGQTVWFSLQTNPARAREEGIETISGQLSIAFGAVVIPMFRERADAVRFLELLLAGGAAGTVGLLLTLVWTSGFAPSFLEPSAASVLLAKPVSRRQLLFAKYGGVLSFVFCQTVLFVGVTWLALGLRTGVWDGTYWWCVPLLLLEFAVFYSFSTLLAVLSRSTVVCAFGSILFWLLAWGMNYGCVAAHNLPESKYLPAMTRTLADAGYWVSPKPVDAGLILFNALDAQHHFVKPDAFAMVESWSGFSVAWSILSCLGITGLLLALAAHEFKAMDY